MNTIELRLGRHLETCKGLSACDVLAEIGHALLIDGLTDTEPLAEHINALCLYERDAKAIEHYRKSGGRWNSQPFCRLLVGEEGVLQGESPVYDLVLSNLAFDWLNAGEFIATLQNNIRPGGEFRFTSLGAATALASRNLLSRLDNYPHFNDFYEMQEIGDALSGAGFKDVSLMTHNYTLEYTHVEVLMADAYRLFGVNLHPNRRRSLGGRKVLQEFKAGVMMQIKKTGVFREQIEIVVAYGRMPMSPVIGGEIPVRVAG